MRVRTLFLSVAMPLGLAAAAHAQEVKVAPDSTRLFPRVEGSNLEGRRFVLPADFEGELNLVFVAFRREQQADVDSWLPFIKDRKLSERGVRVYELPTLNRSYRIMRRMIDGGMARGIPERATREATITLYIDKGPFKRALQIDSEDRIIAVMVNKAGVVLWRVDGAFSELSGERLMEFLGPRTPGGLP